jgi:hypothetical protein
MNLERSLRANLSGMEEAPTGPLQSPHPLDSWNVEERFLDCLRVASCLRAAGGGSGQLVPKPKFRALMDAKKKKKKKGQARSVMTGAEDGVGMSMETKSDE